MYRQYGPKVYIDKMKELVDSLRTAGIAIQYQCRSYRVEGVASD